jgi:hypothetical protein
MKWAIISFFLLTLASCQNQSLDPTIEGFFPEDTNEVRKPNQFADIMAASGARADATLSKQHFDGGKLNSLGEQKLTLMLKDDDSPTPMTVYLNIKENEIAKTRKTAVVAFLKDKGLDDTQIEIIYGDNPDTRSPAAQHIAELGKTDTGETGAGTGASAGATSAGQSGGSSPAGDAGSTATTSAK